MMTMHQQGEQPPADQTCKINKKKIQAAQPRSDRPAENIEAEHIETEMQPTGMQEPGRYQPLVLPVHQYPVHLEFVVLLEPIIGESLIRYKDGDDDNDDYKKSCAHRV
jgi:hypothetical protein